jgi:hypothetical protein
MRTGALVVVVTVAAALAVTGCGLAPRGPVRDPNARPPSPSGPTNEPPASHRPVGTPTTRTTTIPSASASGFGTLVAVACNGKPTGEQVLSLLRRNGVVAAQAGARVTNGPLCAGTWQYTVVAMADVEPIDVVTRGAPNALTLVTAGTNPCTARVRAEAPQGIRSALRCDT